MLNYQRSEWEPLGSDSDKERICTHLLKLSHMWEITAARSYAISVLEQLNLAASRRLQLAGMFTIEDWVKPAVADILDTKFCLLTDVDVGAMGLKVYSILTKAKEKLEEETRRTAFVPPQMAADPSWECETHGSCLAVWPKLWFDQIGRELLHANKPMKLKEIREKVKKDNMFRHPQLSEPCRLDMVSEVARIEFADQGIIAGCTDAIVRYYKSL
jgi:hypothetical protein